MICFPVLYSYVCILKKICVLCNNYGVKTIIFV